MTGSITSIPHFNQYKGYCEDHDSVTSHGKDFLAFYNKNRQLAIELFLNRS